MSIIEHGTIANGGIALDKPLPLPEGSKVVVQVEIETPTAENQTTTEGSSEAFASLPFFGQWADRDDMADSAEYVRKERAKWRQRPFRQD
jgi:hypothetical protein